MDSALPLLGGVFLVLIFAGIPVGYSMILTAATHLYVLSPGLPDTIIAQRPVGLISESFTLLAVPLFLLAGNLLNACGMTARLVAFAVALVGHVRGGLGHAVVVANVIMAGMSGSATADAAGIGAIMIPSLKRAGFKPATAAALTASAATIGPIIPPSVAMVLYASLSNVSLGRLLLAAVIPGLVMGLFLMADLSLSPESRRIARIRFDWRGLLETGRDAVFALMMPAIILGGMFTGVYTPTEGAAAAVAYALFIGIVVYRSLTLAAIARSLRESARTTGAVLFVVATASAVSWIMTAEQTGDVLKIAGITVNEFTRAVWRPFLALVLSVVVSAVWPEMVLFVPTLVMGR